MSGSTPITIDPELAARLLEAAERGEPLAVKIDDHDYKLSITPSDHSTSPQDLWECYDPEKLRAAVANAAGIFTKEEAEELIQRVYQAREEGSRPITRP